MRIIPKKINFKSRWINGKDSLKNISEYSDDLLKLRFRAKQLMSADDIIRVNSFAHACLALSERLYLKRHGLTSSKDSRGLLEKQIAIGKLAEIAVW